MTKNQQIAALVAKQVATMSKFQLAYYEGRMTRNDVNTFWMHGRITTEQRRSIEAEFDKVDEFRRIVSQAQAAAKMSQVVHVQSSSGHQSFLQQEQQRLFNEQCLRNAGVF